MTVVQMGLDSLDPARWQFGITTVYHFILVPFTIGMSLLVAIMETMWYKTGKEYWLKATRFFGKLFLINFALGVATGIVQEFQFGMNWSEYSRFVGDIFGAPLAFEALLSFFMESTFLGLWIFGWGKISKKAHVVVIWLVAFGTNTSMLWIVGANSWMQHPVGSHFDPETGRAQMNSAMAFFEVIGNPVMWFAVFHVFTSAIMLSATMVAGISIWWMVRSAKAGEAGEIEAREIWRPIARWGLVGLLISGIFVIVSGHLQGQHLVFAQPAKMAAAEGLCAGQSGSFALAAFSECPKPGDEDYGKVKDVGVGLIPGALGFVAHNSFSATLDGIYLTNEQLTQRLDAVAEAKDGKVPVAKTETYNRYQVEGYEAGEDGSWTATGETREHGDYAPPVLPVFWSFRLMMGLGIFNALLAVVGLYLTRSGKISTSSALSKLALVALPMPFLSASFGWIMTEIGRQPFIVYPNLQAATADASSFTNVEQLRAGTGADVYQLTELGVSGVVSSLEVWLTMILFTVLYAALGVIWFKLMVRYSKEGINTPASDGGPANASQELSFAY